MSFSSYCSPLVYHLQWKDFHFRHNIYSGLVVIWNPQSGWESPPQISLDNSTVLSSMRFALWWKVQFHLSGYNLKTAGKCCVSDEELGPHSSQQHVSNSLCSSAPCFVANCPEFRKIYWSGSNLHFTTKIDRGFKPKLSKSDSNLSNSVLSSKISSNRKQFLATQ